MLDIRDLTVSLGGNPILSGVSLAVRPGEMVAICGPNGAGKSTLLHAALGTVPATGEARLNGHDLRRAPPALLASLRAVLPQDTQVGFPFTVAEIVSMGLESGDFAARSGVASQALHTVGLGHHARRNTQTLSGGERQRAHLARALAQVWEPVGPKGARWLFLDEPVASLDLGHQLMVMRLARAYADAGGGVIAVMHDLNLSAMFADRIAFVLNGQIAADGRPDKVLNPPLLERAYGCRITMNTPPNSGPWFVPQCCAVPDRATFAPAEG